MSEPVAHDVQSNSSQPSSSLSGIPPGTLSQTASASEETSSSLLPSSCSNVSVIDDPALASLPHSGGIDLFVSFWSYCVVLVATMATAVAV
ncbi:hypothetical protein HETIRDRAFT_162716 [Heterobasidion irregulare TC 32-1]|uniref:Uncharacterized protein n=1 Tax=Heterobasidion irregulare (strain TC 32-1) TaxID=747525 RepID=W4JQY0_HETIT|nr:uncharacterized protein HETIRDRAFT_162716 [Heterobasidion irregulare TC 32-1]ETW75948.1 hypothetical protein HETIRDRAFT_162716 [Heterobasidion irregulare TC 32-1]